MSRAIIWMEGQTEVYPVLSDHTLLTRAELNYDLQPLEEALCYFSLEAYLFLLVVLYTLLLLPH